MQDASNGGVMEAALMPRYLASMSTIGRNLGTNFRAIRVRLGLTQVDVSKRTGIPQNTISSWERGAVFRQLDDIEHAVSLLGADPLELLRPARPELDELAALFDRADATTRDIVMGILRMRANASGRATG